MNEDTSGSTSRRTFVKYGAVSTGALLGSSSVTGASDPSIDTADDSDDGSSSNGVDRAVMFPYQHVPGSRFTVDDSLEWQPRSLEGPYQTYAITYDYAPSYQAYLFADEGDGDRSDDDADTTDASTRLQAGDAFSVGSVRGSPPDTKRSYVTVDLETATVDPSGTDE